MLFGLAGLVAGVLHPLRITRCFQGDTFRGCTITSASWPDAIDRAPIQIALPLVALLIPVLCAAIALGLPERIRIAAACYLIAAAGLSGGTHAAWTLPGAGAMVVAAMAAAGAPWARIASDLLFAVSLGAVGVLIGYAFGMVWLPAGAVLAGLVVGVWLPIRWPLTRAIGAASLASFVPWIIASAVARAAEGAGIVDSPKRATLTILIPLFFLLAYFAAAVASRVILRRGWDAAIAIPVCAGAAWLLAVGLMLASAALA